MNLLLATDVAFTIAHSVLIILNLFGWVWWRTRKIQAIAIVLTLVSWFGCGYWYGWGYCVLTDWHWIILEKRGIGDLPQSYIQWLVARLMGIPISVLTADVMACLGVLFGIGGAMAVRFRPWRREASSKLRPWS